MEVPDEIEDNCDLEQMQEEVQQLQKLGFKVKVIDGMIFVSGEFVKVFDYPNKKTITHFTPKD